MEIDIEDIIRKLKELNSKTDELKKEGNNGEEELPATFSN